MLLAVYHRIDSEKHSQSENRIHHRMLVDLYLNLIETWYVFYFLLNETVSKAVTLEDNSALLPAHIDP